MSSLKECFFFWPYTTKFIVASSLGNLPYLLNNERIVVRPRASRYPYRSKYRKLDFTRRFVARKNQRSCFITVRFTHPQYYSTPSPLWYFELLTASINPIASPCAFVLRTPPSHSWPARIVRPEEAVMSFIRKCPFQHDVNP